MANPQHVQIIEEGVDFWNRWREEEPYARPDLSGADLHEKDLHKINFKFTDLTGANLHGANLRQVNFHFATLCDADLTDAIFRRSTYRGTDFTGACAMGATT